MTSSSRPRNTHSVTAEINSHVQLGPGESIFDLAERAFDSPIHILVNLASVLNRTAPPLPTPPWRPHLRGEGVWRVCMHQGGGKPLEVRRRKVDHSADDVAGGGARARV
ncbi:3-oxoacyl-of acyl-carrier protein reductase [Spatholobus suberectus]|nr:3-oxoacyl-of acyl-carrier protein reductase [Spatholobus suberectus]